MPSHSAIPSYSGISRVPTSLIASLPNARPGPETPPRNSGASEQLHRRASAFLSALMTPVESIKKGIHALWQPVRSGAKALVGVLTRSSASNNQSIWQFKPCNSQSIWQFKPSNNTLPAQMIISSPSVNTEAQAQAFLSPEDKALLEHAKLSRQARNSQDEPSSSVQTRASDFLTSAAYATASSSQAHRATVTAQAAAGSSQPVMPAETEVVSSLPFSPWRDDPKIKQMHATYKPIAETLENIQALLRETPFNTPATQKLKSALSYLVRLANNHEILTRYDTQVDLTNGGLMDSWTLHSSLLARNRDCIKTLLRSLDLETKHDFSEQEIATLIVDLPSLEFLDAVEESFNSDDYLSELIGALKENIAPLIPHANLEKQKNSLERMNASFERSNSSVDGIRLGAQQQNLQNIQICTYAIQQIEIYRNKLADTANLIAQGLDKKDFPAQRFQEFEQQLMITVEHAINSCLKRRDFGLLTRLVSSLLSAYKQGGPVFSLIQSTHTAHLLKQIQDFLGETIMKMIALAAEEYQPRWEQCRSLLEASASKEASNTELLAKGKKEFANIEQSRDNLIKLVLKYTPKSPPTSSNARGTAQTQPHAQSSQHPSNSQPEINSATPISPRSSLRELHLNTAAIVPLCRVLTQLDTTLRRLETLSTTSELLTTRLRKKTPNGRFVSEKVLSKKCHIWLLNKSAEPPGHRQPALSKRSFSSSEDHFLVLLDGLQIES